MNPALAMSVPIAPRYGDSLASSRDEMLGRYRRYSDLRQMIQTEALKNIPHAQFLDCAKRIGLSDGKVLFSDDFSELTLAFDLALHTAKRGRTRAIDRYARKKLPAAEPDEALVLKGLQEARFSIIRMIGKAEAAGVCCEDLMRGGSLFLLDEGVEQSVRPGAVLAMRIASVGEFAMTCGVIVPVGIEIFQEIIDFLTDGARDADLADLADDRRFATSLYELAITLGLMSKVAYR